MFWSPEQGLAQGLREQSHEVVECGHAEFGSLAIGRRFDVVHMHHVGRANLGAWRVRSRGTTLAFTLHAGRPPQGLKAKGAYRTMSALASCIIALGPREKLMWPRRLQSKVFVVPNALNTALFSGVSLRRTLGPTVRLLFVGSLVRVKRVDVILSAVATLRHQGLDVELTVLSHNRVHEGLLRDMALSLGIQSNLSWARANSRDDLVNHYCSANLLVLASESEGRPSVVSEALMTGLPVVAPDVGEISGQVRSAGIVYALSDGGGLASAIASAIDAYSVLSEAAVDVGRLESQLCNPASVAAAHVDAYSRAAHVS